MKALGNYLLSGRFKSMAMISLFTILSLLFPPLSYVISGAPLGLVTMRKGAGYGMQVLAGAFLLTSLFGYFSKIGLGLGAAFSASVWIPVWAGSLLLRVSESQGLTVLACGAIGLLFVMVTGFFNEELAQWWQSWVGSLLQNNLSGAEYQQMQDVLNGILPYLGGIIAAGIVLSLVATLLLARAWQSTLFNPGGFQREFHQLLLPRWLTLVTFLLLLPGFLDLGGFSRLALNVLAVAVILHVFQGLASVHRVVHLRKLSRTWLILMYGFLLFMPQMALILAFIGMADALNRGKKSMPNGDGEL